MLRMKQYSECPPDQWRYKFKQDGKTVKCFDHPGWKARIEEHVHLNGYEKVDMAQAEDQLCRLLPPGWCEYENGSPPEWFINSRVTMDDVIRGTRVLASFVSQGMPLVEKAVAAERGAICAGCPFAASASGCGPCTGISNLIAEIAGSDPLPSDEMLANKSCLICGCAARAQIWLPIELLAKGVTEDMMPKWPTGHCWKGQQLLELKNR